MTPAAGIDIAIGVDPDGRRCVILRIVAPGGTAGVYLTAAAAIKAGAALSRAGAELVRGVVRGVIAES